MHLSGMQRMDRGGLSHRKRESDSTEFFKKKEPLAKKRKRAGSQRRGGKRSKGTRIARRQLGADLISTEGGRRGPEKVGGACGKGRKGRL